jgi:TetR/AcrR family transcriptional regulator, transcriptional repressor for nem operon
MRYSETHKAETHDKLLRAAGQLLRREGPDRLNVAEVMKAAGLTHGGFYAHFKSKDALLVEALNTAFVRARAKFDRMVEGLPPRHALATYIDMYVSPAHRDNVDTGCPIVALNSDNPRQSKKFRATFEGGVNTLVSILAGWIAEIGHENPDTLARSTFSAMAGAVALSRTIPDTTLSDEMLASARASIKARLGLSDSELSQAAH